MLPLRQLLMQSRLVSPHERSGLRCFTQLAPNGCPALLPHGATCAALLAVLAVAVLCTTDETEIFKLK